MIENFDFAGLGLPAHGPILFGVLNVTPDSFSDGGLYLEAQSARSATDQMLARGAHFVDIGAEATSPGRQPLSSAEELARLTPVLKALCSQVSTLSVDTYKSEVAGAALRAGVRIINDVSGLRADPSLASVVAAHDAYLILMYAKDGPLPHVTDSPRDYDDVLRQIAEFLRVQVQFAITSGIRPDRIIVDPGMGRFVSHEPRYSFELIRRLSELRNFGISQPIMLGISRKGFIGGGEQWRDVRSQAAALAGYSNGAQFFRTHDVAMARQMFDVWGECCGGAR